MQGSPCITFYAIMIIRKRKMRRWIDEHKKIVAERMQESKEQRQAGKVCRCSTHKGSGGQIEERAKEGLSAL